MPHALVVIIQATQVKLCGQYGEAAIQTKLQAVAHEVGGRGTLPWPIFPLAITFVLKLQLNYV